MSENEPEMRRHERFFIKATLISVTLKPFGHGKDIWGIITNTSMHGFGFCYRYGSNRRQWLPSPLPGNSRRKTFPKSKTLSAGSAGINRMICLDETYNMGIEIQELKDIHAETDATP